MIFNKIAEKYIEFIDRFDSDGFGAAWLHVPLILIVVPFLLEMAVKFLTYPIWRPLVWACRKARRGNNEQKTTKT